ncbi:uncharacterized protein LOC112269749 [Brachypodium distachyon]|uniref:Uncharacterized protein n=1 Tax=Brachypodium distachyon TaxID=15368 RepID=I1GLN2_BRADI|nr:uncharacterized protein LOC112269749 [Brachypodium distachyon]KQK12492.1 hypothetical protein BRADI_1g04040v3 [Brachypodium distachyon]|eukprot:XP_024312549.1 uncharacterized protein LOC112269749 [Brachypodium distachyon]
MDSEQQQLARGGGVGISISIDGKAAAVREASFRVYYSPSAGAVPFLWESAPGTPKCGGAVSRLEDSSPLPVETASGGTTTTSTMLLLPPISPPPLYSYQSWSSQAKGRRRPSSWTAGGVMRALLGGLGLRKSRRRRRRPA